MRLRLSLDLLDSRAIPNSDGDPYLIRYALIECAWFSIKVHHILESDEDRCEHDHPWPFVSLILTGGYWEWVKGERTWHKPGSLLRRPAHWRHRLELGQRTAWTFVGRRGTMPHMGVLDETRVAAVAAVPAAAR